MTCSTQAFSMSGRRLAGVGFKPFFSFAIMEAAWFSPKALSASSGLPNPAQIESFVGLLCPVGAAVLEHELVDREPPVSTAQEPDRQWLTLGDFPDGVPDITLIDVDLSGLREVEIFGPGVAVVADELYGSMPRPIFTAVEDAMSLRTTGLQRIFFSSATSSAEALVS